MLFPVREVLSWLLEMAKLCVRTRLMQDWRLHSGRSFLRWFKLSLSYLMLCVYYVFVQWWIHVEGCVLVGAHVHHKLNNSMHSAIIHWLYVVLWSTDLCMHIEEEGCGPLFTITSNKIVHQHRKFMDPPLFLLPGLVIWPQVHVLDPWHSNMSMDPSIFIMDQNYGIFFIKLPSWTRTPVSTRVPDFE